jgi:hypothetical protein
VMGYGDRQLLIVWYLSNLQLSRHAGGVLGGTEQLEWSALPVPADIRLYTNTILPYPPPVLENTFSS